MTRLADIGAGFAGATILVVGGRGGVGSAVVDQALALDARVVSASRRGIVDWDAPTSGTMSEARLDLEDAASISAFAEAIRRKLGAIDILVLAGGTSRQTPLETLDDATIDTVFATNAIGPLRLIRDLSPMLKAGVDPVIVNISSVAARTGLGSNIAYGGAKAAMDAMLLALAKALAPLVRTVSIAPSALETPFAAGRGPEFIARTIAVTPLGRLASLEEVATAVLLAARGLSFTTGAVIPVDGGRSL
ncbi:MAG: SDR family oxidoreductase [Sphingomonadales bacterium]|nr:SDR family oxidoreductase [Sphingomonadales bacterium]